MAKWQAADLTEGENTENTSHILHVKTLFTSSYVLNVMH